jgi:hypothetical protein
MPKGRDTRHDPKRQVPRPATDLSATLGQGRTVPNTDYTTSVYPHGQEEREPDYEDMILSRQLRREPEGDTW